MELDLDRLAYESFTEQAKTKFMLKDGVFLPENYNKIAEAVENFEVFNDDVWVCGFPKSGTTWTQEMVWCVTHDADLETAKIDMNERFPTLEYTGILSMTRGIIKENHPEMPSWVTDSVKYCKNILKPRYIKCHLPFNLLPRQIRSGEKNPKIVFVARNPKDTFISYYYYSRLMKGYCGNFEQFCQLFLGDRLNYTPYWNNVLGFWEKSKGMDNLLFLKFEDMKMVLTQVIKQTALFFNKQLNDLQVKTLVEHLSFTSMKKNPSLNKMSTIEYIRNMKVYGDFRPEGEFIRNGNVGQWKENMSDEMIEKFDNWIADNLKNHPDLKL